MRFDDPAYVADWLNRDRYPRIHDHVTASVLGNVPSGSTILDLGSCTGLLSRRLSGHGYRMVAVERPGPALDLGVQTGVYDPIDVVPLRVKAGTLPDLAALVEDRQVEWIVARRVFPELWDALGGEQSRFDALAAALKGSHVKGMSVEGRVWSPRVTHPLGHLTAEVSALALHWVPAGRHTTVAVMGPRWG